MVQCCRCERYYEADADLGVFVDCSFYCNNCGPEEGCEPEENHEVNYGNQRRK